METRREKSRRTGGRHGALLSFETFLLRTRKSESTAVLAFARYPSCLFDWKLMIGRASGRVLNEISLLLDPGQKVGVCGRTGR